MPALAQGAKRSALRIAGAGFLGMAAAMGIGRFAFTPLLPMMQQDAGLSLAGAAGLASANYAGYLAGALCAMVLRPRAVHAIRSALVAIALATLAMALTDSYAAWFAWRAIAGIASAFAFIHLSAWSLHRLAQLDGARLVSLVYAGVGAGIALAGTLCVGLMAMHASSGDAWIALAGLASLIAAAVWNIPGESGATMAAQAAPSRATGRHSRAVAVRLVLCYGAFGFCYIIPATFLPAMARQAVPDPAVFGWSWPLFGLAACLSPLAAGMLQRSMANRRLWICAQVVMALGVGLPALVPTMAGIVFAALAVGGTFMVVTMAAMREARSSVTLIAAMTSAFAAGQAAGPFMINAGFAVSLLLAAALLVASAALLAYDRAGGRE